MGNYIVVVEVNCKVQIVYGAMSLTLAMDIAVDEERVLCLEHLDYWHNQPEGYWFDPLDSTDTRSFEVRIERIDA